MYGSGAHMIRPRRVGTNYRPTLCSAPIGRFKYLSLAAVEGPVVISSLLTREPTRHPDEA